MINKFCSLLLCSAVLGVGSAEAATVSVNNATNNGTFATAVNLDAKFDKLFDANIGDIGNKNISTTFAHASAKAVTTSGGNGFDWYSFNTYQANVKAFFDIDKTSTSLNSFIKLYDSSQNMLGFNDNASFTSKDAGSTTNNDSFLALVLNNPGLYYLSVGRANGGSNQAILQSGHNYTLNISLSDHTPVPSVIIAPPPVPVPAAVWLFGSGIVGLIGISRKKKA